MSWTYEGHDPGLALFSSCLRAGAPMPFTPGMRVLEVGCCEADWLHLAHAAWPEIDLVGVDWRAPNVVDGDGRVTRMQADAMHADLFAPASFDAVVSLSAIEHFGLGHYSKDPLADAGDTAIMANIFRWLKPGGWVYFDVPYDPTGYAVKGTECRVYDDDARWTRLWQEPLTQAAARARWAWEAYAPAGAAGTLVPKPTAPVSPFHYAAMVWIRA